MGRGLRRALQVHGLAAIAGFACLGGVTRASAEPAGSSAAPAAAAPLVTSVRLARPWVIQPEFAFAPSPPRHLPGYAHVGLSVQRALGRHLDLELMFGKGLSGNSAARRPGERVRAVSVSTGVHTRLSMRAVLGLDARDRWALSAGLAPMLMFAGDYAAVALMRGEAAIEFRALGGFSVLYALGYDLSLVNSRTPFAAAECVTSDCPTRFESGRGQVSARLALGISF